MSISVVIPTYNCGPYIGEAIDSVLGQSLPPDEIVVVDDGSTDDTPERVAAYAGRVRYIRQENARVSVARNRGIAETSGELIAFLDADDVWHPAKLERQLAVLRERPEIGALGTRLINWPQQRFVPAGELPPTEVINLPMERMLIKNELTTSSVIVRRNLIERLGAFDPTLFGPEDYDMWIRIGLVAGLAKIDLRLAGHRNLPGSLNKQSETMRDGLARIMLKLDAAGVWRGRSLLRRKANGYVDLTSSIMFQADDCPREAFRHVVRSLLWYPFPYRRSESNAFARARLLFRSTQRLLQSLVYPRKVEREPENAKKPELRA
jgi:glycosyltransferase involved in cell wall biosynthesis